MRKFILMLTLSLSLVFTGCKTVAEKQIEYVPVKKIKTEYIHNIDSIYLHDSINTYILQKGDTVYVNKYKQKIKEIYKTDTICKTDTVPTINIVEKQVEVNKLYNWQKALMYIGGVGLLILLGFILKKLKIWKLPF